MSSVSNVEIRLHAYPQLLVDGRMVPLQLKRAWGMVACLADHDRKISRACAANLLWPDADIALGRTRLRRLVHQVNTTAGLELIGGDADALWLSRQPCAPEVDLVRTRSIALRVLDSGGDTPFEDAAELLRPASHTIMADFSLESEAFEEWLAARRQEHERLLVRALQRMGERQIRSGKPEGASACARRLLDVDPFADAGHALLIQALGNLGQAAAMEVAYDRCATLMRHEFGVRPSASVEAAYAAASALERDSASAGGATAERFRSAGPLPSAGSLPSAGLPAESFKPILSYASTSAGSVAFATLGEGSDTLVLVPEAWSHIETSIDEPRMRAALDRLAKRFRLVMLDRRGVGMSERIGVPSTPEAAVDDVLVVMDRLKVSQAWLLGSSTCGAGGIEFAALHPERVHGLILVGVNPRGAWAPDYPWAMNQAAMQTWITQLQAGWGRPTSLEAFAPSVAHEPEVQAWWTRTLQHSTTPNGLPTLIRTIHAVDVRHRLPTLGVPTLVVQRRDDRIVRAGAAEYLARTIPGAELRMLDGADHFFWHGESGQVLGAILDFVARHARMR